MKLTEEKSEREKISTVEICCFRQRSITVTHTQIRVQAARDSDGQLSLPIPKAPKREKPPYVKRRPWESFQSFLITAQAIDIFWV